MFNRTYYTVTTSHPSKGSRWDGEHMFRVSADNHPDCRLYYATSEGFGCGRSYNTPEAAIRMLALDNGASVVSICYHHEDEI
jgi:hypothetical protein